MQLSANEFLGHVGLRLISLRLSEAIDESTLGLRVKGQQLCITNKVSRIPRPKLWLDPMTMAIFPLRLSSHTLAYRRVTWGPAWGVTSASGERVSVGVLVWSKDRRKWKLETTNPPRAAKPRLLIQETPFV